MRTLLSSFIIGLVLMGCSPEKRIAHFQRKLDRLYLLNPEFKPKDSISERNWTAYTCDSFPIAVAYQEVSFDTTGIIPDWVNFHHTQRKGALSETLDISKGVINETASIDSGLIWEKYDRAHDYTERKTVTTEIKWKEISHWWEDLYKYGFWILLFLICLVIFGLIYVKEVPNKDANDNQKPTNK